MHKYHLLSEKVEKFVFSLINEEYGFKPAIDGTTSKGELLNMGYACYALKILYTIDSDYLKDTNFKTTIRKNLENYKQDYKYLPRGSYVDPYYYKIYKSMFLKLWIKNILKFLLGKIKIYEINPAFKFREYIRAETKQTIATMSQIFPDFKSSYVDFPMDKNALDTFFKKLDWNYQWNAGAQISGICVFLSSTDQDSNLIHYVDEYLKSKLLTDGSYGTNNVLNSSEKINGAMKVITGLDWLNLPIHEPDKLIDLCLSHDPMSEGCDLVDIIYVLYKCKLQTDYKSEEIKNYYRELLSVIEKHYHDETGGFSYFINKSQTHYYGIKITEGLNEPDLHGTILLVWGLSMIFLTLEEFNINWKVIKP